MITSKDVRKEMEIAENAVKDLPPVGKIVVKLLCVILKVLLSIRTNTKLIMGKVEAKPIEARRETKVEKPVTVAKVDIKVKKEDVA